MSADLLVPVSLSNSTPSANCLGRQAEIFGL